VYTRKKRAPSNRLANDAPLSIAEDQSVEIQKVKELQVPDKQSLIHETDFTKDVASLDTEVGSVEIVDIDSLASTANITNVTAAKTYQTQNMSVMSHCNLNGALQSL